MSVESKSEWRTQAKCCRACAAFDLMAKLKLKLAEMTRNRLATVSSLTMKLAQLDGTLVVTGSSIVSLSRIALKSKDRARSKMQSAWKRLSEIMPVLSLPGSPNAPFYEMAICCIAC